MGIFILRTIIFVGFMTTPYVWISFYNINGYEIRNFFIYILILFIPILYFQKFIFSIRLILYPATIFLSIIIPCIIYYFIGKYNENGVSILIKNIFYFYCFIFLSSSFYILGEKRVCNYANYSLMFFMIFFAYLMLSNAQFSAELWGALSSGDVRRLAYSMSNIFSFTFYSTSNFDDNVGIAARNTFANALTVLFIISTANSKFKIYDFFSLLVSLLTTSRTYAIVSIYYIYRVMTKKFGKISTFFIMSIIISSSIIMFIDTEFSRQVSERYDVQNDGRVSQYVIFLRSFLEIPITGYGIGEKIINKTGSADVYIHNLFFAYYWFIGVFSIPFIFLYIRIITFLLFPRVYFREDYINASLALSLAILLNLSFGSSIEGILNFPNIIALAYLYVFCRKNDRLDLVRAHGV